MLLNLKIHDKNGQNLVQYVFRSTIPPPTHEHKHTHTHTLSINQFLFLILRRYNAHFFQKEETRGKMSMLFLRIVFKDIV